MLTGILPRRRDRAILFPAIGSQLIVATSLFLMPLLIDTLAVHTGLSGRAAGYLLSMELAVSALTTLGVSAWARGHSARQGALFGGILTVAATAVTLVSPALPALFATRFLAGIGAGIVGAEATSVLSRGADRERLIAIVTIASIVDAAIWLAILPFAIDRFGCRAPYACLLLICLGGTLLLMRLPSLTVRRDAGTPRPRRRISLSGLLLASAVFLTQLGQGAFWSLEETYGASAGFASHAIGIVLSLATLLLLLGAVASAWAGNRFGRYATLLMLVAVNAASIAIVGTAPVPWVYVAANVVQSVTNLSSVIYQLGLAAAIDRLGRVVAICAALVTLGNGLGPGLSASLAGNFGAPAVGIFVLGLNALAIGLFALVRFREHGESRSHASHGG